MKERIMIDHAQARLQYQNTPQGLRSMQHQTGSPSSQPQGQRSRQHVDQQKFIPSPSRPIGFQGSQNTRPGGSFSRSSSPSVQTGGATQKAFANASRAAAKGSMGDRGTSSRITGRGNATFQRGRVGN